jgi:hypothetical protein
MPREFNTESRKDWNHIIHQCLKAIDNHNSEYFKDQNQWHLDKAQQLRKYVVELKEWIIKKELNSKTH